MPKLPLFPSRQHERGGSHERTDGNLTTEEEWFLEIKLDDLNLSNDSTWLTLRGKRKRMRREERRKREGKNLPPPPPPPPPPRTTCAAMYRETISTSPISAKWVCSSSLLLLLLPAGLDGSGYGGGREGGMMVHYATWARGILHLCQPAKSRGWVFVVCL